MNTKERTKSKPYTIDGVVFCCYRYVGTTSSYVWMNEDESLRIGRNWNRDTYWVRAFGTEIGRKYRSLRGAMRAAVEHSI